MRRKEKTRSSFMGKHMITWDLSEVWQLVSNTVAVIKSMVNRTDSKKIQKLRYQNSVQNSYPVTLSRWHPLWDKCFSHKSNSQSIHIEPKSHNNENPTYIINLKWGRREMAQSLRTLATPPDNSCSVLKTWVRQITITHDPNSKGSDNFYCPI